MIHRRTQPLGEAPPGTPQERAAYMRTVDALHTGRVGSLDLDRVINLLQDPVKRALLLDVVAALETAKELPKPDVQLPD